MGSSNRACAISKAPICPGDKVKLFYIVNNAPVYYYHRQEGTYHHYSVPQGVGFHCYDNYRIVGLPMEATYDDCGSFNITDNSFSRYNIHIIKASFTSTPPPEDCSQSMQRYYDIDPDNLDIVLVDELINEGLCFLESSEDLNVRCSIEYFAVLEDVYNSFVYNQREYKWNDGIYYFMSTEEKIKEFSENYYKKEKELNDDIQRNFEDFQSLIGNVGTDGLVVSAEDLYELAIHMATSKHEVLGHNFEWSYKSSIDVKHFKKIYADFYTSEDIELALKTYTEVFIMIRKMNDFNLEIQPSRSASQSENKIGQASMLLNTANSLLNYSKNVKMNFVPGFIEIGLSEIRRFANEHWSTETTKQINELVQSIENSEHDILIKAQGKYSALYPIFEDAEINIKIKIQE